MTPKAMAAAALRRLESDAVDLEAKAGKHALDCLLYHADTGRAEAAKRDALVTHGQSQGVRMWAGELRDIFDAMPDDAGASQ